MPPWLNILLRDWISWLIRRILDERIFIFLEYWFLHSLNELFFVLDTGQSSALLGNANFLAYFYVFLPIYRVQVLSPSQWSRHTYSVPARDFFEINLSILIVSLIPLPFLKPNWYSPVMSILWSNILSRMRATIFFLRNHADDSVITESLGVLLL